jgi:23S rRNA (cytosine1962-C5)-methyltransferase
MRVADSWKDFEILDASGGERLERWGKYILVRPDPQVIWNTPKTNPLWQHPDGKYIRSVAGGGQWDSKRLPAVWSIAYKDLTFNLKPMNFKHTGLFPEQAVNWDFMRQKIKDANRPISVLNLFAYTGGATLACTAAGASVVHVDASKGMVQWAMENAQASGLREKPIRYLVDDCIKFVQREIRRGNKYDAIIMDPPSYGRGPGGEIWKLEENVHELLNMCMELLSINPIFMILNSYTTGLSPAVTSYLLGITMGKKYGGKIISEEIGLPVTQSGLELPCGSCAIWECK